MGIHKKLVKLAEAIRALDEAKRKNGATRVVFAAKALANLKG